ARRSERHAGRVRPRAVWRRPRGPLPSELLPVHGTERGDRHQLRRLPRRWLSDVQAHGLAGDSRQRHGAPRRLRGGRLRSRAVHGFRVRYGPRACRPLEVGCRGHPSALRERPALPGTVSSVKIVLPWLSEMVSVPSDVEEVAREISLRGFEVASVEARRLPSIDFEITANRPDCLSHLGIAREAATIWRHPLRRPETLAASGRRSESKAASQLEVRLEDEQLCPRYCAQVFEVSIGPSPQWLADRLEAAGVRPISNVVDVTNYVMLEIGQPMHAFDLAWLPVSTSA